MLVGLAFTVIATWLTAQGNGLNVIKVMPESAIKFGAYEATKRAFAKFEGHSDPAAIHSWSKFASGGVAGMISQFAVYPIDTLKL
jgi:solute carrier family 25 phosphate transporter 23/24/25/41